MAKQGYSFSIAFIIEDVQVHKKAFQNAATSE
jgi:hypothetical protein